MDEVVGCLEEAVKSLAVSPLSCILDEVGFMLPASQVPFPTLLLKFLSW